MNEGSNKIGRSFLRGMIERFVSDLLAVPGICLCILVHVSGAYWAVRKLADSLLLWS